MTATRVRIGNGEWFESDVVLTETWADENPTHALLVMATHPVAIEGALTEHGVAFFWCQLDHYHDADTCVPTNIVLGDE